MQTEVPEINIAKIVTCESLSGLSTLEYHVGYEAGSTDHIHFRIWKNSGGGKFNTAWISLQSVEAALADIPADRTFNASALAPIALGMSVNTFSFIAAALLAEGLIARSETAARCYRRNSAEDWWREMQALIAAGVSLEPSLIGQSASHSGSGVGKDKPPKRVKPTSALPHSVS